MLLYVGAQEQKCWQRQEMLGIEKKEFIFNVTLEKSLSGLESATWVKS
jgi:hypothetical protein